MTTIAEMIAKLNAKPELNTREQKLDFINKHAFHPHYNRFGLRLNGITIDERVAEVQAHLAAIAAEYAALNARILARA